MRAANRNRLKAITSKELVDPDWKRTATRKMLPIILYDGGYAKLARKAYLQGTPPDEAKRYEAQATAYVVDLCRRHGEDKYADLILAESSNDMN